MSLDELPIIHPVQVVARENKDQIAGILDIGKILADRVRRPLKPGPVVDCLLGRQDGDEILVKTVEAVGGENVAVQRFRNECNWRSGCR
jgi:hypothetical protein